MAGSRLVSVLFSDIEGSTRLWEDHRDLLAAALAAYDRATFPTGLTCEDLAELVVSDCGRVLAHPRQASQPRL